MPKFTVTGLTRDSGKPIMKVVEAESSDDAISQADFLVEVAKPFNPSANTPPSDPTKHGEFHSLDTIGFLLNVVGGLAAAFGLALGLMALGGGSIDGSSKLDTLVPAFFLVLIGLVTLALGEICKAVRAITVNTYKA